MRKPVSLFLLLIVLAASGCSTVTYIKGSDIVEDETQPPAGIVPGEYQNAASIIFLGEDVLPLKGESYVSMDDDIVSCLENRIKKHNPDQALTPYYKFVNTMFPDLSDWEVPREPESFSTLLADEKFYKDVLSWDVRYLIFVSGSTRRTNDSGGWFCVELDFLCAAYASWDVKTRLTASILDLHQKETVIDDLENISEGTSWWGFIHPIPIPIWYSSSAESNACEDIGNRLGKILLDRAKQ